MRTTKIERVRGVNDVLPRDCAIARHLENTLRQTFESFGYQPIDLPLIEYTELYLKKSGEDIAARLYDFTYRNRRLCLRPEITASAIRAYIDHLQGESLPVRLSYSGPAFRYERPQRGRSRQFTQMGIELIGASGTLADAEIVAVACQGLDRIGLKDYCVSIGNVGLLNQFLENLELENRLQNVLLAHMELLRKGGRAAIEQRLQEIYPSLQIEAATADLDADANRDPAENISADPAGNRFAELFQAMQEDEARLAMLQLLESMNIDIGGNREPEEIVDRLLAKLKRQDRPSRVGQALAFMEELGQLVGSPAEVLKEANALLAAYKIETSGLDRLQDTLNNLQFYDLDNSCITLDLGLSRGLQYYTGMVFEIHSSQDDERQLCGGGRYDDLVASFGGRQQTPATGFSYGLERLQDALKIAGKDLSIPAPVDILVVPVGQADNRYAIGVTEQLRQKGLRVAMDVKNRNLSNNFQYANKQGIPFAIVIGPEERTASEVVLKNMTSGEQQRLPLSGVVEQIYLERESHAI